MIVKDEELVIARCLDAVKHIVDEIIIVDTGSIDDTKKIIRGYTNHIYDFQWINDFAEARNFSFSKATKDYILWLDADDVLLEKEQHKLLTLKKELNSNIDAVSMLYHHGCDSNGNPFYITNRNRLVKRKKNFKWQGKVHEYIKVKGNVMNSDIIIIHRKEKPQTDRNFKILQTLVDSKKELTSNDKFHYANECMFHQKYNEAIYLYTSILDNKENLGEVNIHICGNLGDCYTQLQKWDKAMEAYTNAFQYGTPRGEICVRIAHIFMAQQKYKEAILWYKTATKIPIPTKAILYNPASYTWIPYLQMCVCYNYLGDHQKAFYYNELAAKYIPNDPKIIHNQKYFDDILPNKRHTNSFTNQKPSNY
ncbi:tetratricopeptide repeat-containing glycosyltransferase family 2 protein [Bacillus mycoides]|uniref:tetratricopeptide repeat-containing glycosyltransferase family 2 protein n=1 Tax=Bacillus mycoides TaxID=1405 RepID=UPI003463CB3A